MQALDKKAGRTMHYHPGFSITSAQLLRAIDELDIGASSKGLKELLKKLYTVVGEDDNNLTDPVTTDTITDAIATYFPVTTPNLLQAIYDKIGNGKTASGTTTTADVKDAISSIPSYYWDSVNGILAAVNLTVDTFPTTIAPTDIKELHLRYCPALTDIPNLNLMTNMTTIDLGGSTVKDFTEWDTLIGSYSYNYDGNRSYHPSGLSHLAEQKNLAHIIMPDSYTSVGNNAFYYCSKLQSINMPGVTSVGDYAFYKCTSLVSIELPKCESVGTIAFCDCSSLTSIELPLCTSVGYNAFDACYALASVDLPLCTKIGQFVFNSSAALQSLTLHPIFSEGNVSISGELTDGTGHIYPDAFVDVPLTCDIIREGKETMTLAEWAYEISKEIEDEDVTSIDENNYRNKWISKYTGENITTIEAHTFYCDIALKEVIVPKCESIGSLGFYFCNSLDSITLPFNCAMFGMGLYAHFYNCPLTTLNLIWPSNSEGNLKEPSDIWADYKNITDEYSYASDDYSNALTYESDTHTFTLDLQTFLYDNYSSADTVYKQITNIYIRQWNGNSLVDMPTKDFDYTLIIRNCGSNDNAVTFAIDSNWNWVKS